MKRVICIVMVCVMLLVEPTSVMASMRESTQQQNTIKQESLCSNYYSSINMNNIYSKAKSYKRVSDKTYKISYKQLASFSGETSSYLGLALLILERCSITVSNPVSAAITIVGVLASIGGHKASTKHGIYIKVRTRKYYRTRLGRRRVYKTTRYIVKVGKY